MLLVSLSCRMHLLYLLYRSNQFFYHCMPSSDPLEVGHLHAASCNILQHHATHAHIKGRSQVDRSIVPLFSAHRRRIPILDKIKNRTSSFVWLLQVGYMAARFNPDQSCIWHFVHKPWFYSMNQTMRSVNGFDLRQPESTVRFYCEKRVESLLPLGVERRIENFVFSSPYNECLRTDTRDFRAGGVPST